MKAVDEDLHEVGGAEIKILAKVLDQELFGFGVETDHADVEIVLVVDEPGLGAFRRGHAVPGK
ncbi:MAG: hypothetical protein Q7R41_06280, partial [Phycisphaerales bacterium]|nr:hypothetical protein [Phycisphaerales bacterium]